MSNNKIYFLTFRNFAKSGGGAMRISGMINSVSQNKSIDCILLANLDTKEKGVIADDVKHIPLDVSFSIIEKRVLQFLLSFLPFWIVTYVFRKKIDMIRKLLVANNLINKEIIFLEYLDISIGYILKKNNYINNYICDIHGLVPNEFKQKKNNKIFNYLKYLSAKLLDKKVFLLANKFIFASESMKKYFYTLYPSIKTKKFVILPYFVTKKAAISSVDSNLLIDIKTKYSIKNTERIIFFAGNFKYLGGITDLVTAFAEVTIDLNNVRLFIIGEGEELSNIKEIIQKYKIENKVILAGLIPYNQLRTYQEIASIIVCPDKENLYSNMILHLKYFDSLISNKIVINGSFKSVMEINKDEALSINFTPSDISSLRDTIIYCLNNENNIVENFKSNANVVFNKFTYDTNSNILLELNEENKKGESK
jgi:glycosyltransferase involved in cell wall biosynthesis